MFSTKTDKRCVIQDMTQIPSSSQTSNGELLWCRACLATEVRLFRMDQCNLIDVFSRVVGICVIIDKLPLYLCTFCHALVLKFASFRDMCVTTQKYLTAEIYNRELNAGDIKCMHKFTKQCLDLTRTDVEIVTCKTEVINVIETPMDIHFMETPENINVIEIPNIVTKTENNIYDEENPLEEDITDIKTQDIKVEPNVYDIDYKYDTAVNIEATNEKAIKQERKNIKRRQNNITVGIKKVKQVREKRNKKEVSSNNIDKGSSEENKNLAGDVKNGEVSKLNLKKKRSVNSLVKVKKEMEETARNKAFESKYSVRIVVQSKEEQVAEILARKESRNYDESAYRCEQCFKGFNLATTYENHMLTHDPSRGEFSCDICHIRLPTNHRWHQHRRLHRLKIFCNECQFVSQTRSQALLHNAVHAGKTFDCPHCGKSFLKKTSYFSHVRLVHPAQNVACELCGEMFVGQLGLKMHKAKVHKEKIKCTVCSAKFANLAALNRHMDAGGEHRDLPCEQCGENCASETALQEHAREKHPTESHRCEECVISFPSALALETHVLRKHTAAASGYRKVKSVKPGPRGAQPARRPPPRGHHMCDQCGKILRNTAQLRNHQRSHDDAKPYACDQCPKAFTTKVVLTWHMRTHTGEKPYQCSECPLAFSIKANLTRHHKTVHLGVRGCFPCHICSSTTTSKSTLRVHIDAKHGGKGWPRSRKRKNKTKLEENK